MKVRASLRSLKSQPGSQVVRRRGKTYVIKPPEPTDEGAAGMNDTATTCDAAIIGGGAAGLAAALLLARAHRDVVVIDDGTPRNAPSAHARGFLSRDSASPAEILAAGGAEVARYGGRCVTARVDRLDDQRLLHLSDGSRLRATRVVLATGLRDALPDIPGVAERWGRDVLHCPYCHGYEAGRAPFVVLGTHPNAVHHSLLLRQWSPDVTLAVHDLRLSSEDRAVLGARGVRLREGRIEEVLAADDAVVAVRVDGADVPATAVFLFPEPRPRDAFVDGLGVERDELGFPRTDPTGRTSVPWLYAAGNATDPRLQVLSAAGHGQQVHNAWVMEEAALGA